MKKKNINARVQGETFYEVQTVAWFLDVSRSNLVRDMIEYFREKGTFKLNGREYSYRHIAELAFQKLEEQNILPEDLIQVQGKKLNEETSVSNSPQIEELAKVHVKSIKNAWLDLLKQAEKVEER